MPSLRYPLTMLYDGGCPLCSRQVALLKRLANPDQLRFSDLHANNLNGAELGISQQQLMAELHVIDGDGALLRGPQAMRAVYQAAGLDGLVRLSRLPLLRQLFDAGYRAFARWRPASKCCNNGRCTPPS